MSRSVEKQVNHTLVGLAGVTIASASENASIPLTGGNGDNKAPKNVATNSKNLRPRPYRLIKNLHLC